MKTRILLGGLFVIGLIYVLIPVPSGIDSFPALPDSVKSNLPGDTVQNPNIAAYFSAYRREFITSYYQQAFRKISFGIIPIPPLVINHPPELAWVFVRDMQESTFLEENVYPLRGSVYVNGFDPVIYDKIHQIKTDPLEGDHLRYDNNFYNTKTTLRYYPVGIFWRVLTYLGIWVVGIALFKLSVRVIKNR